MLTKLGSNTLKKRSNKQHSPTRRDIIPKELLNLTPNLIFVLSADGTILEVNNHACTILQLKENELLNVSFYQLCQLEEREKIALAVRQTLLSRNSSSLLTKLKANSLSSIDVSLHLSCYPANKLAKKRYCVMVGRDVSEEKRRDLELLRFSNIAQYTVNPVEITDADGKIIYVNPAFERASGYSKEELLGKNPKIFGAGKHPKEFWKKMWDTVKSGKVWVGEVENRRRSGEPIFVHLLISPIIDKNGIIIGYFAVHRDITEQKHLEQHLIHAQKMESIGLLAAGIAHEVGNPLASISSLVQVIQRTTQDNFIQEKLELIKNQINRISRIIRDIVDFSRQSSYELQLTDINKTLREAIEIVRVGRKAKEILFHSTLDESIPPLSLVPDHIAQVFINILINAVDAITSVTDEEFSRRMVQKKEITATSFKKGKDIVITIQDTGRGIPEKDLPKIFEPFFTTKKVGEGTGLGLWVSYGIIKSFHGTISVKSIEHEGTIFTITIPIQREL